MEGGYDQIPFGSSDEEDDDEEDVVGTAVRARYGQSHRNEDAFSSSSEEEEEDDLFEEPYVRRSDNTFVSEFDRALMSGATNTGAASFDGNDLFLSQTEESTPTMKEFGDEPQPDFSSDRSASKSTKGSISISNTSFANSSRSGSQSAVPPPPPPPPPVHKTPSGISQFSDSASSRIRPMGREGKDDKSSQGGLPDVVNTVKQKIESLNLFDADIIKLSETGTEHYDDRLLQETRESLKRSSQQSLSAAVLVSLAHKRYERRRLAAMEIEKVVRSLAQQGQAERIRAILLLLSDDYVRSTSEDARKGGVVALAACAIGLKKARENMPAVPECQDLILASVVHACQDHSQRVRYYATESLFNVVKVIPALAVQHFFILFEILRSLYADVDVDVRSGAELLDKKLKEVIVGAINSGSFTADACVPIFARFVHMRNKATKRLTLTWLQELNEKLIGVPILEFLHLFLGDIFAMIADPNISIRQAALAFLQSVLPKLLMDNEAFDDDGASLKVDFDKLIQSLDTTLEHPDPFVRKVAMHWMYRIVKRYMSGSVPPPAEVKLGAPSASVRNALPHVLPGILLSIGDRFNSRASSRDSFLPDQTTYALAEQTNKCLLDAVGRDGQAYVSHLDGFIVALREELSSPGGLAGRKPPANERKQYRVDVQPDGSGIESTGWFRSSKDTKWQDEEREESMMMSRMCALEWIVVLYENVVPDSLKAEYAKEFITPIIHQLIDDPPEQTVIKSLEVLANITVPVKGESGPHASTSSASLLSLGSKSSADTKPDEDIAPVKSPFTDEDISYALEPLSRAQKKRKSRDRAVFSAFVQLHASNHQLLADLSRAIQIMCTLQPPEFVFVSFATELERFMRKSAVRKPKVLEEQKMAQDDRNQLFSIDLQFLSSFVQQMCYVLLNSDEAKSLRTLLKDCIGRRDLEKERDQQRTRVFSILLHSFSHNLVSSVLLCLWAGAYRSAASFLQLVDPLDINLVCLLEIDKMVEMLERPLFRHLHLRMLENDRDPTAEGSGAMLFKTLKLILMIVPQSTCYKILRDRLVTISRYRQSALAAGPWVKQAAPLNDTPVFVDRVLHVRKLHCEATWETIRSESLETPNVEDLNFVEDEGADRRAWLGYNSKEEEAATKAKFQEEKRLATSLKIEEVKDSYEDLHKMETIPVKKLSLNNGNVRSAEDASNTNKADPDETWKDFWTNNAGNEEQTSQ